MPNLSGSSASSVAGSATPRGTAPAQPETEEQAWKILWGYLSAHPLQLACEPTIPLGTTFAILLYLHSVVQAGLNNALNTDDIQLPSFPQRNLPGTDDDDIVLWQYYRQGHSYGTTQRINALARAPVPVTPVNAHPERIPKPKMAVPKVFTRNRAEFTNFLM